MKTIEIGGVEFNFQRVQPIRGSRMTWQVSLKKTGKVMDCFHGKTLEKLVEDITHVARVCGERFKPDTER